MPDISLASRFISSSLHSGQVSDRGAVRSGPSHRPIPPETGRLLPHDNNVNSAPGVKWTTSRITELPSQYCTFPITPFTRHWVQWFEANRKNNGHAIR